MGGRGKGGHGKSPFFKFYSQIQSWIHKAGMCGFNLVPVPMLQTLCKADSHPFGSSQYIPLHLPPSICGFSSDLGAALGYIMSAIISR